MKIIILSDHFDDIGAATGIAYSLAKYLKRSFHDVHVITSVQDKKLVGKKISNGVTIWSVYSDYNLFWRAYVSLYNHKVIGSVKKIIDEVKPDIVHAHNIHSYLSYHSLKIAKKSNAKVFLTAHDVMLFHYGKLTDFFNPKDLSCPDKFNYKINFWRQFRHYGKTYNPFRNLIIRHYLKYVDKIFSVSDALRQALSQNGIFNVEVVYNGVNTDYWRINQAIVENFKKKFGLFNKKLIFFGGRVNKAKGSNELILALVKISKEIPETNLIIAGKIDEETKKIIDFANQLNVDKSIVLTDRLFGEDLKAAYWASDIVVIPSICFDSFPSINIEAMACARPVVGTCFGGAREAIVDGKTGYVVNPYNTNELAGKIIDLLKNPEKAHAFGQAGYERVKEKFNLENMTNTYLSWYQK